MAWIYIVILVVFVAAMFAVFKRPMYEAVFGAFIFLCIISGKLTHVFDYMLTAANTYLLFSIAAFTVFSLIFEKTGIINGLIDIITALVGRFSGGTGYVALLSSGVMGTLCGSAPGTAAAIGVTTIPAMKKSGFSPELAAAIESAASCLGPIIPPAGAITALYASIEALYPGRYSFSQLWLLAWVVSFWFVLQRFLTLYFTVKKYHVKPVPKEERLPLRAAFRRGWRSLIVPLVIFVPFLVDALLKESFITPRLGSYGAGFTNILLTVIPSVSAVVAIMLYKRSGKKFSINDCIELIGKNISGIAPIIVMAFGGFAITELFNDLGVAEQISASIAQQHFPLWFVAVVVPLGFTVLGMFIEPFSLIVMFGGIFIAMADGVGINPLLAAMMFDAMTCGLAPMTPPFALSQFVCMGIADSDFKRTSQRVIPWVVSHYALIVLCLLGIIPMFGALN